LVVFCSVSDPYSFYTDPDRAFQAEYRSGSGSRVLMTKNWSKFIAEKNKKIFSRTTIYLSLDLNKGHPGYRRSLKPTNETIQQFKT
jgi:hypothetical protein